MIAVRTGREPRLRSEAFTIPVTFMVDGYSRLLGRKNPHSSMTSEA